MPPLRWSRGTGCGPGGPAVVPGDRLWSRGTGCGSLPTTSSRKVCCRPPCRFSTTQDHGLQDQGPGQVSDLEDQEGTVTGEPGEPGEPVGPGGPGPTLKPPIRWSFRSVFPFFIQRREGTGFPEAGQRNLTVRLAEGQNQNHSQDQIHLDQIHQDQIHQDQIHLDQIHLDQIHQDQNHSQDQIHLDQIHQDQNHSQDQIHLDQIHSQDQIHLDQIQQDQIHLDQIHLEQIHQDQNHSQDQIHLDQIHPDQNHSQDQIHLDQIHQDQIHSQDQIHQDQIHSQDQIHLDQIHQDQIHLDQIHLDQSHLDQIHLDQISGLSIRGRRKVVTSKGPRPTGLTWVQVLRGRSGPRLRKLDQQNQQNQQDAGGQQPEAVGGPHGALTGHFLSGDQSPGPGFTWKLNDLSVPERTTQLERSGCWEKNYVALHLMEAPPPCLTCAHLMEAPPPCLTCAHLMEAPPPCLTCAHTVTEVSKSH
ncbi:hypothetical protein EYF80_040821 [Liparis tanakae]|uniref:Uncharacterized protein n=1 Tax=Liparis tanakae TaxID=230148 RepID=A0A4Z2G860_9TELE|nr:hypothetical protein EYF80_040821 [Liparis tanakae]